MSKFKPRNPIATVSAKAAIARRTGDYHVLYVDGIDIGGQVALGRYLPEVAGHACWIDSTGIRRQVYMELSVEGHTFIRRAIEEMIGNFGVTWVSIHGQRYQLDLHR